MKTGTKLAMILLSVVAVAHLLRLVLGGDVVIGGWVMPSWPSILGTVIPAGLALMIYREH